MHIVEFIDPACETCAQFFPLVKQLLAENPDRIRLSIRHVAFHDGSDYAVRLLEASRKQDKYLPTLEALLASQAQWAPHHTVQPDLVLQAISGVGLNIEQLLVDMNAPEVAQRMEQDRSDAVALKVTATPEYFVNGRPMPSFGEQQLHVARQRSAAKRLLANGPPEGGPSSHYGSDSSAGRHAEPGHRRVQFLLHLASHDGLLHVASRLGGRGLVPQRPGFIRAGLGRLEGCGVEPGRQFLDFERIPTRLVTAASCAGISAASVPHYC